ncbi:MAG: hypothetical protein KAJ19_09315, partial [Gammaproteobacteria bacterium]|nr:hypothetical protein [Gammaproteobacteria bacterium]
MTKKSAKNRVATLQIPMRPQTIVSAAMKAEEMLQESMIRQLEVKGIELSEEREELAIKYAKET